MDTPEHPAPITVSGKTYSQWRYVRANPTNPTMEIMVDDDAATMFLSRLSRTLPGTLRDGTRVQFFIYSVQRVGPNEALVMVIPEFAPSEEFL